MNEFLKRRGLVLGAMVLVIIAMGIVGTERRVERQRRYFSERKKEINVVVRSSPRYANVYWVPWKGAPGVAGSVETNDDLAQLKLAFGRAGLADVRVRVLVGRTPEEIMEYGEREAKAGHLK